MSPRFKVHPAARPRPPRKRSVDFSGPPPMKPRMSHPAPPTLIRAFRETDLPRLREITAASFEGVSLDSLLEEKFGTWNEMDWRSRKVTDIAGDCAADPGGVFVAEVNGTVAGYITTRLDRAAQKGRIPNLAVAREARGCGLGRRLIEHALDHLRRQGMKLAQIETMSSNPIGQHLYPACGFEEVARQVHYAMRL